MNICISFYKIRNMIFRIFAIIFLISIVCILVTWSRNKHCDKYFENCKDEQDHIDPFAMFDEEENEKEVEVEKVKLKDSTVLLEQTSVDKNDSQCSCKELSDCQKRYGRDKSAGAPQSEFLYIKRSINKLTRKFASLGGEASGSIRVDLTITINDISVMKSFVESPTDKIQDLDGVLSQIISAAVLFKPEDSQLTKDSYIYLQCILIVITCQCLVIWYMKSHLLLKNVVSIILLFVVLLDIAWNWIYLVKKEYSDTYAEMDKRSLPDSCHPDMLPWGDWFRLWFTNDYSFSVQCKKYYESIHVSPEWRVSPVKAVSETFKNTFLYPLQFVGEYVGLFYQRLFSQLSWYLMVPVSIIITLLMFMLLVMLFGYRIRFPFFLGGLEPALQSRDTGESDDSEKHLIFKNILEGNLHLIKSDSIKSISLQSDSMSEHHRIEPSTNRITEIEESSLSKTSVQNLSEDLTNSTVQKYKHTGLCVKCGECSRKFVEDELRTDASENNNL